MAIYGNRNTGEITPNNFATRPGVIPGKIASAPSTDYLFGSNLGILQEENNLSISKATIRSAIPRPFMLGSNNNTNQTEYRTMLKEVHPVQMERETIWDVAKANPVRTLVVLLLLSYPAQKLSNQIMKVFK